MSTIPEPCSKETLLMLLDDIRAHVEADDSFEGFVEYTMPWSEEIGDPMTDGPDTNFRVRASYRIGNSQGQGGMRMIGKIE
jgi:hypothetical protein